MERTEPDARTYMLNGTLKFASALVLHKVLDDLVIGTCVSCSNSDLTYTYLERDHPMHIIEDAQTLLIQPHDNFTSLPNQISRMPG